VIDSARALLSALQDGPVPLTQVTDQPREALLEAGVELREADGHLHLESLPDYGWGALVTGLDLPLDIEFHESLPSTNDRARTLAQGGRSGVAVVAGRQTGGRGRHGRHWHSPDGGVWCSLILEPTLAPERRALVTFAAAIAICKAAASTGVECVIKWPNDVIVPTSEGDRKLAGVLTESGRGPTDTAWVIVGIGLNADIDAEDLPPDATSLRAQGGGAVDRSAIAQNVLTEFWRVRDRPERILSAWRSRTSTVGRMVAVETATRTLIGTATDVTDTGALVLETQTGREVIAAGECEHLRPTELG
jgi:BirA family biotin operon repressor/biotin-[acetyl-CoA-carboxylase] ligase